ncbi:MAG: hypothetical protein ACWA5R_02995 [bacterium]
MITKTASLHVLSKATMQQAMKTGGSADALKVCNTQAMPISRSHSQSSG